jgi:hypothetical protein
MQSEINMAANKYIPEQIVNGTRKDLDAKLTWEMLRNKA